MFFGFHPAGTRPHTTCRVVYLLDADPTSARPRPDLRRHDYRCRRSCDTNETSTRQARREERDQREGKRERDYKSWTVHRHQKHFKYATGLPLRASATVGHREGKREEERRRQQGNSKETTFFLVRRAFGSLKALLLHPILG